ncbi:MAG: CbiX/SirB N-terminal domain-containing protein [Planctomycetes bacterium]|nr:CbiX/SirB N-terminal domain-containing protein [Planctomycetota bacterium]
MQATRKPASGRLAVNLVLFVLVCAVGTAAVFAAAHVLRPDESSPPAPSSPQPAAAARKVGVVLVSHGSHSEKWRDMLVGVERGVRDPILAQGGIHDVRTAFMEYTEPSIATRLEEFDKEGCTDVLVVPLLLTVSSHSFDDIPTICGQKEDAAALATLRSEGIRTCKPRARVHITPTLDYPALLESNVTRRVRALSRDAANEGVVLVAYGDHEYDAEWTALMERLGSVLRRDVGVADTTHSWCGHIASYKKEPTIEAIRRVLATRQRVLVVPILVAVDETFQYRIIGGAVQDCAAADRVIYTPDAVLPEPALNEWVIRVVAETHAALGAEGESK